MWRKDLAYDISGISNHWERKKTLHNDIGTIVKTFGKIFYS